LIRAKDLKPGFSLIFNVINMKSLSFAEKDGDISIKKYLAVLVFEHDIDFTAVGFEVHPYFYSRHHFIKTAIIKPQCCFYMSTGYNF